IKKKAEVVLVKIKDIEVKSISKLKEVYSDFLTKEMEDYKVLGNNKSLEGSLAMFLFSFVVSLVILYIFNPVNILLYTLILAVVSTVLEVFSPYGLDNL
ncbi:hypothetical protein AB4668_20305, partial [Clostridium sp. HCS.1]